MATHSPGTDRSDSAETSAAATAPETGATIQGETGCGAGAVAAARPDDYLITAYRDHAHALRQPPHDRVVEQQRLDRAPGGPGVARHDLGLALVVLGWFSFESLGLDLSEVTTKASLAEAFERERRIQRMRRVAGKPTVAALKALTPSDAKAAREVFHAVQRLVDVGKIDEDVG